MAKTYNRNPLSFDVVDSDDLDYAYQNMASPSGINENKNFVGVDQNSFSEAENVYIDDDGLLSSRPGVKDYDVGSATNESGQEVLVVPEGIEVINIYNIGGVVFYHLKDTTSAIQYRVDFVLNDKLYSTASQNTSVGKNIQIIYMSNMYVIFGDNILGITLSGEWKKAETIIYIPTTTVGENQKAENPNIFTSAEKTTYLYSDISSGNATFSDGDTIIVTLDNEKYSITWQAGITEVLFNKLITKTLYNVQTNGNVVVGETDSSIYYSYTGKLFTELIPPNGYVGNVALSQTDNIIVIVLQNTFKSWYYAYYNFDSDDGWIVGDTFEVYAPTKDITKLYLGWQNSSGTIVTKGQNLPTVKSWVYFPDEIDSEGYEYDDCTNILWNPYTEYISITWSSTRHSNYMPDKKTAVFLFDAVGAYSDRVAYLVETGIASDIDYGGRWGSSPTMTTCYPRRTYLSIAVNISSSKATGLYTKDISFVNYRNLLRDTINITDQTKYYNNGETYRYTCYPKILKAASTSIGHYTIIYHVVMDHSGDNQTSNILSSGILLSTDDTLTYQTSIRSEFYKPSAMMPTQQYVYSLQAYIQVTYSNVDGLSNLDMIYFKNICSSNTNSNDLFLILTAGGYSGKYIPIYVTSSFTGSSEYVYVRFVQYTVSTTNPLKFYIYSSSADEHYIGTAIVLRSAVVSKEQLFGTSGMYKFGTIPVLTLANMSFYDLYTYNGTHTYAYGKNKIVDIGKLEVVYNCISDIVITYFRSPTRIDVDNISDWTTVSTTYDDNYSDLDIFNSNYSEFSCRNTYFINLTKSTYKMTNLYTFDNILDTNDYVVKAMTNDTVVSKIITAKQLIYPSKTYSLLRNDLVPISLDFNGHILWQTSDNATLYTNEIEDTLELSYISDMSINNYVPDHSLQFTNDFISIDTKVYWRTKVDDNQIYFSKGNELTFASKVTNLVQLSETTVGVFLTDEVYLITYQGIDSSTSLPTYTCTRSKLQLGCRDGDDVLVTYDGSTILLPTLQGLTSLSYEQLMLNNEQVYSYLSDNLTDLYKEYVADGSNIKLAQYKYNIIVYSPNKNYVYLYNLSTSTWWKWTCSKNIDKVIYNDENVIILIENKLYTLTTQDDAYYDFDGEEISWHFKSQRLHMSAPNNYKHIYQLIVEAATEDKETVRYQLACTNYRKSKNEEDAQVFEYNIDGVSHFVKRCNYYKTMAFQYELSNAHSDNPKQFKLSNIVIKYRITEGVR